MTTKDTLNLEMMWKSFNKYCVSPSAKELGDIDPQILIRMSFIAGVQSACTCLESDRTSERYVRLCNELAMMRKEVTATLDALKAKSMGKVQ